MNIEYFSILQPIIFGSFLFLAVVAALRRRPDVLLALNVTSFGFGNFWVMTFGTILFPFKIVGILSMIYVFLDLSAWSKPLAGSKRHLFLFMDFWLLVAFGLAYWLPVPYEVADTLGTQGVTLRPVVQLAAYSTAMVLVPLAFAASRVPGALNRVMGIYAAVAIVVCIVGAYQYVALKLGLGFMPIYRPHGEHSDLAAFQLSGEVVTRLYSTAGEPKSLGIFLTPFVTLGICLSIQSRRRWPVWWNRRSIFAFAAVVDILTYSSAILLALGVSTLFVISWNMKGSIRVLAVVLTIVATAAFMALSPEDNKQLSANNAGGGIGDLLYTRTFGRLRDEGSDRLESKALRLIAVESPSFLPAGFGLGMADYRIEGSFLGAHGFEPINSGWINILMDMGVIGVITFITALLTAMLPALKAARLSDTREALILRACCAALIGACAAHLGTGSFVNMMIWLGVTWAARGFILNLGPSKAPVVQLRRWERPVSGPNISVYRINRGKQVS